MAKIVFLGTSVTYAVSYGGLTTPQTFAYKIGVANGYAPADILNKGVNGDTSVGMLARLSADVLANAPAVCVVEVGPNDWLTGVPVATFRANMASIFGQLVSAGIKPVAFNSSMRRGPTGDFTAYQPYLKALEEEAAIVGAPTVDLYREMATSYLYYPAAAFAALYVGNGADVIHLSAVGHQFAADLAARPKYSGIFV